MDKTPPLRTDATNAFQLGVGSFWGLVFLGLVAWQAWMTLTLFGAEQSTDNLQDDQIVASGRHALHLYHGFLGAQTLLSRGTVCCYDPAFNAGYPKTPVFDSGSRPAELFCLLSNGEFLPAAYKMGLAGCCLAVPLLLFLAARGAGLSMGASTLATASGLMVWWSTPGRDLIEAGDLDLLLGGLATLAQTGMLLAFHRSPGFRSWLGLLIVGCLGWFAHPLLFAATVPILLIYYFCVGPRHGFAWQVALLVGVTAGVGANLFWLVDWFSNWWIRAPMQLEMPLLSHRTFHTLWSASLWGDDLDRLIACVLLGLAGIGLSLLNQSGQKPAARMLGLGTFGLVALAIAGVISEILGQVGTARLLVPALWFASLPAGYCVVEAVNFLGRLCGGPVRGVVFAVSVLAIPCFAASGTISEFGQRFRQTRPLELGLAPEELSVIEILRNRTLPDTRILWEDPASHEKSASWTPLLPMFTGCQFLGGLGAGCCIEHSHPTLVGRTLSGRDITTWSDADLDEFFRRYAVSWIVCRNPIVVERLKECPLLKPEAYSTGSDGMILFKVITPHTIVLKGQARVLESDWRHISLADVIPEDGQVVLSMHYQAGMRVSPNRVQIEKDQDDQDSIPFIRLRVQGPVAVLTLSWQGKK